MTKAEAILVVLSSYRLVAQTIDVDYDPAGSTYTYAPSKRDLEVLSALTSREVTEEDLSFSMNSRGADFYIMRAPLVEEIVAKLL